jgi:hypothetical protein
MWVWPWLGGMILIGFLGRYGGSKVLPDWVDVATVAVFSLAVYLFAVRIAVSSSEVEAAVAAEEAEIAAEPELNIA